MTRIVAITGMAGAGKGIAAQVARSLGHFVFVCGDVVREEARRRNLPETPQNLGQVMLDIRKEDGPSVVAKRLISKMAESESELVVVEGVRSIDEIVELRRHFPEIMTIAVHASPSTRFKRILARRRDDDPQTWDEFEARDLRELDVGIGKVIALADEMIVNETTVTELEGKARKVIEEVSKC